MAVDGSPSATEIRRHTDLRIPVLDDTVGAMRYEPVDHEGPRPTVLMYVPYPKDDLITFAAYDPSNRYLAKHGYDVVVADMVGTGSSTGTIDEMFLRREGEEAAEIVRWLAAQEWSSGRVGMYGKSYGGITALDTAAQAPEPLEAIVPIHTPYQGKRNVYTYGGLLELLTIGMNWLSFMQVLEPKPPTIRDGNGDWVEVWKERLSHLRSRDPWIIQFLRNGPNSEYWADKNIPVEDIEVPTLAVGGWRDPYPTDTVEYFQEIDAPKRLLFGPWRHQMPHRGREARIDFRRQLVDWFDHYLKGVDNGVPAGDTIQFWTETGGGGRVDGGVWRGREGWPHAGRGARSVSFSVAPEGLVPPDEYDDGSVDAEYEIDHTVGMHSIDPYGALVPPQDTAADDARSLTFDSQPLTSPLDFTGTGMVSLRLAADDPDPTVSVRVVDVAPDGSSKLVTHGTMRAQYRTGRESPTPLDPGREYDIEIPLEPKSHLFEAGHRVRLAIAGTFFPEIMPAGDAERLTIRSSPDDPAAVDLPGRVRDDHEFEEGIDMAAPDRGLPIESQWVNKSEAEWETTRERVADRAKTVSTHRTEASLPHVDITRSGRYEATVQADDPDTLLAKNELELTLTHPSEEITITATSRFDRDSAKVSTRVRVDEQTILEERWLD